MIKSLLFLLVLFSFLVQPAEASFFDWQEVQTSNFFIYYPAGLERQANQIASIAEEVHDDLSSYLDYEPRKRTHLIVFDDRDITGGWADVAWDRRIGINLSQPILEQGFGSFENWVRLLITHEYTHILQLSLPPERLFPLGWLSYLFPPILLQPYWFVEGFAIHQETALTEGGRGESPVIEGILNAQASGDNLYSYDQIQGLFNLESWPGGGWAAYNYGARFLGYIGEEYGEDVIREMARRYPENPLRGFGGWFNHLTGDNIQNVFLEWQGTLNEKEKEMPRGITEPWGYNTGLDYCSKTGRVAYFHQGEFFPSLRLLDAGEDRQIIPAVGMYGGSVAWSPEGDKLAYASLKPKDLKELYHQIYILDLETGSKEQVTTGRGGKFPAWSSDGELAYVENVPGGNRVVIKDLQTGQKKELFSPRPELDFKNLSWDTEGKFLAVSVWQEGGYSGLWIWDKERRQVETVFIEEGQLLRPSWSENGLLFAVGITEDVPQIIAYDRETEKFWQVTDYPYGTYEIAPGGEKDFISILNEDGFQIASQRRDRSTWEEKDFSVYLPYPDAELVKKYEIERRGRNYPLFSKLSPRLTVPLTGGPGTFGALMLGWDPLELVQYEALFLIDLWSAPIYQILAGIFPDEGRIGTVEMMLQGGRARGFGPFEFDSRRVDGGQFLLHFPLQRQYFSAGTLHAGGALFNIGGDPALGLNLGWSQGFIRGKDKREFQFDYYLDSSGWNFRNEWIGQVVGQGQINTKLRPGTNLGGLTLGGVTNGNYNLGINMRSYADNLEGEWVWLNRLQTQQRLWSIKRGFGGFPLFADSISFRPYFEGGLTEEEERYGAGVELIMDWELLHGRLPAQIKGGISYNKDGEIIGDISLDFGLTGWSLGEKFFKPPFDLDNLQ